MIKIITWAYVILKNCSHSTALLLYQVTAQTTVPSNQYKTSQSYQCVKLLYFAICESHDSAHKLAFFVPFISASLNRNGRTVISVK